MAKTEAHDRGAHSCTVWLWHIEGARGENKAELVRCGGILPLVRILGRSECAEAQESAAGAGWRSRAMACRSGAMSAKARAGVAKWSLYSVSKLHRAKKARCLPSCLRAMRSSMPATARLVCSAEPDRLTSFSFASVRWPGTCGGAHAA